MATIDRRTRSDGSISWRVRWREGGTRAGAQRSRTFSDQRDAEAFGQLLRSAGHTWTPAQPRTAPGVARPSAQAAPTFAEVASTWLTEQERRVRINRVKAYTVHRYRGTLATHFTDWDDLPVDDLDAAAISDWIDHQLDSGASPKSIRNRHGIAFSVLRYAYKQLRVIPSNPCELTELPREDAREARQVRFLRHEEWALMRSCLRPDVHLLVDLMLTTGVRWGEVSALRIEDVSWHLDGTCSIQVRRAWSTRAPRDPSPVRWQEQENAKHRLGPPKSKRARIVVVAEELSARLGSACEGRAGSEYVFTTARGNPWRYTEFHSDRWRIALAEARRRGMTRHVTPHMLRHTAVVWSLAAGVPLPVVSEMLGHASIQVTYDVYGGLIDVRDPQMAHAMARQMVLAHSTLIPTPPSEAPLPIRPGPRSTSRRRAG